MILVTGAAGFIGREVCRQLLLAGHEVLGLDRDAELPRQQTNLADLALHDLIVADLLEVDLQSLLTRVDGIVHLAGSPGVQSSWSTGFETHLANNILATQRLAEAMLDVPGQRMVVASSSSVYGSIAGAPADENQTLSPLSPYGASKAAMEHVVGAYVTRGVDIIALRYFTVYGPHQRPDMAMSLMLDALTGGQPFTMRGDGSQRRNFTFVQDAAAATIAALTSTNPALTSGTRINIGGPATVSVTEVLDELGQLAGSPVPTEFVAPMPGDPTRTAANIDLAGTLLNWRPQISLREGLKAQLDWHRRATLTPVAIDITNSTPQIASPTSGAAPLASPSGINP